MKLSMPDWQQSCNGLSHNACMLNVASKSCSGNLLNLGEPTVPNKIYLQPSAIATVRTETVLSDALFLFKI